MIAADALPSDLRSGARAVLWNRETRDGKPTKVPYQAHHPAKRAAVDDPSTWAPLDVALAACEDGKSDGVGVVLGEGLVGVDLDGCRDALTGELSTDAWSIVAALNSYTEISPSGTGVHVLLRGELPAGRRRKGNVELYSEGRYFTLTGAHLGGTPRTIELRTPQLAALHARIFAAAEPSPPVRTVSPAPALSLADDELLERATRARNGAEFSALWWGDTSAYGGDDSAADLALCNHLAFWTGANRARIDGLFRESGLMRPKWDERRGDRTYGEMTIGKALDACRATFSPDNALQRIPRGVSAAPVTVAPTAGEDDAGSEPAVGKTALVLDPGDPLPSARAFLEREYVVDDVRALHHQSGVFYGYAPDLNAYLEREEAAVRADLYRFLESARRRGDGKTAPASALVPFKPNRTKVEHVLDALRAVCVLPQDRPAPCWWTSDAPAIDPFDVLACTNGLLHIPTRRLLAPTPAFFTLTGLGYAYARSAPPPERWLRFLAELWPSDEASRETLREWFAYLLTPRTSYQKAMLLIGPKRSGKGTIARIARRLLGERNVCGPTLASMAEPFGMQVLIGKSVAIIADARISGRVDSGVIAERILSISGEDAISIPRKYAPDWTGKLTTRFWLISNELPRLDDASGALASRFLVLQLERSFYGQEDHDLESRLVPELPGILNWALEGYDRLAARRRFAPPSTAADLMQELEDLGSPISAFVRDRCLIGAELEAMQDRIFEAWKAWCGENGREHPGTAPILAKNLRAAVPGLRMVQHRVGGSPRRFWAGLALREDV